FYQISRRSITAFLRGKSTYFGARKVSRLKPAGFNLFFTLPKEGWRKSGLEGVIFLMKMNRRTFRLAIPRLDPHTTKYRGELELSEQLTTSPNFFRNITACCDLWT